MHLPVQESGQLGETSMTGLSLHEDGGSDYNYYGLGDVQQQSGLPHRYVVQISDTSILQKSRSATDLLMSGGAGASGGGAPHTHVVSITRNSSSLQVNMAYLVSNFDAERSLREDGWKSHVLMAR